MRKTITALAILLALTGTVLAAEVPGQKYRVETTFYNDSTRPAIHSVNVIESTSVTNFYPVDSDDFVLRLRGDGEQLFEGHLHISFKTTWDAGPNQSELPPAQQFHAINRSIRLPYHPEAARLHILQNGTLLRNVSLPERICVSGDGTCTAYCERRIMDLDCTCGNGVCDPNENEELCFQDCGPDPQQNNTTEPVEEPAPTPGGQQRSPLTIVLIGILALVGIGLIYYFARQVEVK